jgi:long-chain-fatty-acid--[acyl-carrier-protein] ligase
MCGKANLRDSDQLGHDLALDSLKRSELLVWLETEFGFPQGNTDSVQTVGDVLLAASGEAVGGSEIRVDPPGPRWLGEQGQEKGRLQVAAGDTIAAAFLAAAQRDPARVIVADAKSGLKSFRELITGIFALLPAVEKLPGERVGIMLPASVGAALTYLTVLFAGRTPVMINWTVGRRNLEFALELSGTERILTARALVQKFKQQGLDLGNLEPRLVYLEDLGAALSRGDKLLAFLRGWLDWGKLRRAKISRTAAILFTSGSETVPKAVPLTHLNVLTDLRDTLSLVEITSQDRLLGMLPPFHSFGLTIDLAVPLTTGMRTLYHANPTEGAYLGKLLEAYQATVVVATPTFLQGIV